jgi:PAS domain S-box-containing protein
MIQKKTGQTNGSRPARTSGISERKRAEEALRASQATYRAIFNATNDGIVVHDMATGEIVDANAAFLDQHGCTSEEARRLNVVPLGSGEAPHTQEDALRWIHKAARGQPQRFEWQSKDRDGRLLWLDITLKRATIAGQDRVLAISRNITERKQAEEALRDSEQQFRTLSEASFEGIAIHDKGRILEGNRALATMFGYEVSEVIGMHALDLTAPESRDLLLRNIASKHREPFELTGLRKDGTTFPVEGLGSPIPYRGKRVTVAALRDITERKRMEEAFQKAREELEARVERQMERRNPYGLTFRELTVLHMVAAGKADKEIGYELGISPLTTHKHLGSILSKMGAASRTEASVRALREGLLD